MEKVTLFETESEAKSIIAPGKMKSFRIGGLQVCLIHKFDGGWVATQQYCPHMDYPLAEGYVNPADELVCPWHGYRFSLKHGTECSGRNSQLKTYPVSLTDEGKLAITL